jgi:hypothetical protein
LNQALAIATSIGNPTQLWQTYAALAHYHAQRGDKDAARSAYSSARSVIDGILSGLSTSRLRGSLDKLRIVRELTAKASM